VIFWSIYLTVMVIVLVGMIIYYLRLRADIHKRQENLHFLGQHITDKLAEITQRNLDYLELIQIEQQGTGMRGLGYPSSKDPE
jgi:cell division protein FtsL